MSNSFTFYQVFTYYNDLDSGNRMESSYQLMALDADAAKDAVQAFVEWAGETVYDCAEITITDTPQLFTTRAICAIPRHVLWVKQLEAGWTKDQIVAAADRLGYADSHLFAHFISNKFDDQSLLVDLAAI